MAETEGERVLINLWSICGRRGLRKVIAYGQGLPHAARRRKSTHGQSWTVRHPASVQLNPGDRTFKRLLLAHGSSSSRWATVVHMASAVHAKLSPQIRPLGLSDVGICGGGADLYSLTPRHPPSQELSEWSDALALKPCRALQRPDFSRSCLLNACDLFAGRETS